MSEILQLTDRPLQSRSRTRNIKIRFSGTDPFSSFDFFDQMGDNMLEYGDTRPYIINDVSTQLRQDQNGNWIFN